MRQVFSVFILSVFLSAVAVVAPLQARQFDSDVADLFSDEPEFLPVEQAFIFNFAQQDGKLVLSWEIAEGYYLYKKQYKYVEKTVSVSEPQFLSQSVEIEDEYFGISDVFFQKLEQKQQSVLKLLKKLFSSKN